MKLNILIVAIIFTLFSCSIETQQRPKVSSDEIDYEWKYILDMQNEKWSREKVVLTLGHYNEIYIDPKSKNEYLIYKDTITNHQTWSIGYNGNQLTSISFFPSLSNENNFTEEQVIKYWQNCQKKVEVDSSKHFIQKKKILGCDLGRKARINNLGQIEGLFIEF
jgi:hypothetical protein